MISTLRQDSSSKFLRYTPPPAGNVESIMTSVAGWLVDLAIHPKLSAQREEGGMVMWGGGVGVHIEVIRKPLPGIEYSEFS